MYALRIFGVSSVEPSSNISSSKSVKVCARTLFSDWERNFAPFQTGMRTETATIASVP